ncbi:MAG: FG-GAP-like repeat-containing protein [Bacteroidota bacterium]
MRFPLLLLLLWRTLSLDAQSFVDITVNAGLNQAKGRCYGLAWGDYDADGDPDLYVSRHGGPNLLYQNQGELRFKEVADKVGLAFTGKTTTAVWGDLDNDGDLDLYLGNEGAANRLFENVEGKFQDITTSAKVGDSGQSRAVLLADVDQDGLLDIYVANLLGPNRLYRNLGNLRFQDITDASGTQDTQLNLGAIFLDYDRDGDQDLYLTHDNKQPNILLQNDGSGQFTDVSAVSGSNYAGYGMGVDAGDVNNDGWLDLYITNLSDNILLLNQQDGTFQNITGLAKISDRGMGWGTSFLDFDNDGWLDIYAVNDSDFSPFPNVLYRNLGNLAFDKVALNEPISSLGAGYATAKADIDGDGLLDLALANTSEEGVQLFHNQNSDPQNWLSVKLIGSRSNRDAIGASLSLRSSDGLWTTDLAAGSGYAAQNAQSLHIGLGNRTRIDSLYVRWPEGTRQAFAAPPLNQEITIIEGLGIQTTSTTLFNLRVSPNPLAEQMEVFFMLPFAERIHLSLLDSQGRIVRQIREEEMAAGLHRIGWELRGDLSPGLYIVRLQAKDQVEAIKLMHR